MGGNSPAPQPAPRWGGAAAADPCAWKRGVKAMKPFHAARPGAPRPSPAPCSGGAGVHRGGQRGLYPPHTHLPPPHPTPAPPHTLHLPPRPLFRPPHTLHLPLHSPTPDPPPALPAGRSPRRCEPGRGHIPRAGRLRALRLPPAPAGARTPHHGGGWRRIPRGRRKGGDR